jgi:hypothetical protein
VNIVDWDKIDLKPKTEDRERKQIFKTLLERTIDEKWRGKINRGHGGASSKHRPPKVEIRKRLGSADILISVGRRAPTWNNKNPGDEAVTLMSMNGTAEFTTDDFVEMSLAAAEARGMFDAVFFWRLGKNA